MIVRPASGSHICLRCQRGLIKRNSANAFASQTQTPSQSTNSKPQQRPERRKARKVAVVDIDHNFDPESLQGLGNALDYKTFRNAVGGGLHGYRGLQMQENRESLNRTTLGDPADVLVLRDSLLTLYAAGGPRSLDTIEPEHVDILSQLEGERGLVGQNEVERNLNAFRPANERQSWEEINELVKKLQDGFTVSQLQRYIRNFQGRQEPEPPLQSWVSSGEQDKILRVTRWLPGVSEIQDYFDNDPLRGYFLPSHTVKQRIVLQLLRECWMLELPELVDGVGQFEIEVSKENLELLLMGQVSVLDQIHSEHLPQEDERLEAFRKRSVIRVTGAHVKKPFIVEEIEAALKRIRRETVPLADLLPYNSDRFDRRRVQRWAERSFDSVTLQSLGRLTNTSITFQEQNDSLVISCIDTSMNALVSGVDLARRLLLISSNPSGRVEHRLVSNERLLEKGAFVKHEIGNTLPWRDRFREWARWTAPTPKEKLENVEPVTGSAVFLSKNPPREERGNSEVSKLSAPIWSPKYFTETSAILGKVLHSNTFSPQSPPTPLTIKGPNYFHTFSTQVSNLSRVLSMSPGSPVEQRTDRLILRFLPNPFVKTSQLRKGRYKDERPVINRSIGSEALLAFPTIEMRFIIDPITNHATLQVIQAIVQERMTDVLLPHNNSDVRFQQRTTSRLNARAIKPFHNYLQKGNLSLKGSEILQIPPSIRVPIEKHLCRGKGFKLLDDLDRGGDPFPDANVRDVDYLFAGLEIRRSLSFEYNSWRLFYTSIEAGKAGGRKAELKLRPILGDSIAKEDEFISQAYKLASEIGDLDPGSLLPEILVQPRKVQGKVRHNLVRRLETKTPAEEHLFKFNYFARKLKLGSDPEERLRFDHEQVELDEQSDDPYREDLAEEKDNLSEGDKRAKVAKQQRRDAERAAGVMEDDLGKIEDNEI